MPDAAPLPCPALADLELARLVLVAEREAKAAERTRKALGQDLLERMQGRGVARLEVEGEGLVTLLEATTTHPIDTKACAAKLEALGAQLRGLRALAWRHGAPLERALLGLGDGGAALAKFLHDLDEAEIDDTVPLGTTHRSAGLRITPRL